MKKCCYCGTDVEDYVNWCTWECAVTNAKNSGGKIITPNDLRITVIRADGTMLEHEHADHPDYKFPITIEWMNSPPRETLFIHEYQPEPHALIYCDGNIAVTIYECCYYMWYLRTGAAPEYSPKRLKKETNPYQIIANSSLEILRQKFPQNH